MLPSMEMSVRSLGCTCAISERTLMLNFSNCLKPAPVTVKPANAGPPSVKVSEGMICLYCIVW